MAKVIPLKHRTTFSKHSTLKVCNALASMLSSIEEALDSARRVSGYSSSDTIAKTLECTRQTLQKELTLAKLRHEGTKARTQNN